jgi:hypothetical protein
MSRGAIERDDKIFFAKIENRTSQNREKPKTRILEDFDGENGI